MISSSIQNRISRYKVIWLLLIITLMASNCCIHYKLNPSKNAVTVSLHIVSDGGDYQHMRCASLRWENAEQRRAAIV